MSTPICRCKVPVKDGYLCHDCTAQLKRNLLHLAEIVPALDELAAVGRGGGIPQFIENGGGWVAENRSLPVNLRAVEAVRHCYDTGVVFGHVLVAGFMPPPVERRKIVGLLGYASEHVDLVRREEDAASLLDDVLDVVDECAKVLDRKEEERQSAAATDARNQEAFDTPMELSLALLWLKIYRGKEIPKRTALDWIKDKRIPERRNARGEHQAIPSTLLEEYNKPRQGRRTTAA